MERDKVLDGDILDIIQNTEIREQKDLQEILKERGHNVPQATLSRHLKKLKIAKVGGVYNIIDFSQQNLPLILNLQISEYGIIVMHTHPGQATSLAYFIDRKYVSYTHKESSGAILGTIAGDDTVLLITKSQKALKEVLITIHQAFPYLKIDSED